MKCRQEQERQKHESRQNKELREKETEESVKEQKKRVRCKEQEVALSDGSLGRGVGLKPQKRRGREARPWTAQGSRPGAWSWTSYEEYWKF